MIDVGDDREIADVIHLHRVFTVAAKPRLKKRVPAGTLCSIGQKARILADFAQIITDFDDIEEVMTEFAFLVQQYRNQFVIKRFEFGVGIHIKNLDVDSEFFHKRKQGQFHFLTEMAIGT